MGNTEFMNKLQFPLLNKNASKNDIKDSPKNDNTIRPKPKIQESQATFKASSISLYNCKEGVLDNWDDDFDMDDDDDDSKIGDSSMSFTITPGI